jgi:hypothetical protein
VLDPQAPRPPAGSNRETNIRNFPKALVDTLSDEVQP